MEWCEFFPRIGTSPRVISTRKSNGQRPDQMSHQNKRSRNLGHSRKSEKSEPSRFRTNRDYPFALRKQNYKIILSNPFPVQCETMASFWPANRHAGKKITHPETGRLKKGQHSAISFSKGNGRAQVCCVLQVNAHFFFKGGANAFPFTKCKHSPIKERKKNPLLLTKYGCFPVFLGLLAGHPLPSDY